jgi:glycolate oxidase
MSIYSKVTPKPRNRLEEIVGKENVSTTPEDLEKYGVDESPLQPHPPEIVVKPRKTEEVQKILKLANESHGPVTPMGSTTIFSSQMKYQTRIGFK